MNGVHCRILRFVSRWLACPIFLGFALAGLPFVSSKTAYGAAPHAVVVATSGLPNNLDPHKGFGTADTIFASNVFETPFELNPTPKDGRGEYTPLLALSWKQSDDGKVIDLKIRQDVYFHDGSLMTAEDVKYSIDRAIAPDTKNPYKSSWLATIEGADVLDATTVRIRMSRPWAGIMDALAARGQVVPKAYIERVGDAEFSRHPIGTGPMVFVDRKIGDAVEFKGFDRYWGKKLNVTAVTWRQVPDLNTRVAMLANGEADLITDVLPSLASTIEAAGGKVDFLRGVFQRFLVINAQSGTPLADQRVRLALNLAIDRNRLINAVFGRDLPLVNGPLGDDQIGGKAAGPYPYDPGQAKKLMADAGYANGISIDLNYAAGRYVGDQELLPAFASYWKRVGIQVNLKPMEQGKWIQAARSKEYSGLLSYSKAVGQVKDPLSAFDRHILCGGLYSGYCNKEVDALVESSVGVIDEKKLADVFSKAQKIAHDDAAQVFLFEEPYIMAHKADVRWNSEFGPDRGCSWNCIELKR
jgi:peptide/nickel transport system substrate-binding protein